MWNRTWLKSSYIIYSEQIYIIGIYTDAPFRTKHNMQFGFKFGLNMLVNTASNYTRLNAYYIFPVTFFSTTFHITANPFTGFMQGNFGTKAVSFQIGTSYRFHLNTAPQIPLRSAH